MPAVAYPTQFTPVDSRIPDSCTPELMSPPRNGREMVPEGLATCQCPGGTSCTDAQSTSCDCTGAGSCDAAICGGEIDPDVCDVPPCQKHEMAAACPTGCFFTSQVDSTEGTTIWNLLITLVLFTLPGVLSGMKENKCLSILYLILMILYTVGTLLGALAMAIISSHCSDQRELTQAELEMYEEGHFCECESRELLWRSCWSRSLSPACLARRVNRPVVSRHLDHLPGHPDWDRRGGGCEYGLLLRPGQRFRLRLTRMRRTRNPVCATSNFLVRDARQGRGEHRMPRRVPAQLRLDGRTHPSHPLPQPPQLASPGALLERRLELAHRLCPTRTHRRWPLPDGFLPAESGSPVPPSRR